MTRACGVHNCAAIHYLSIFRDGSPIKHFTGMCQKVGNHVMRSSEWLARGGLQYESILVSRRVFEFE